MRAAQNGVGTLETVFRIIMYHRHVFSMVIAIAGSWIDVNPKSSKYMFNDLGLCLDKNRKRSSKTDLCNPQGAYIQIYEALLLHQMCQKIQCDPDLVGWPTNADACLLNLAQMFLQPCVHISPLTYM